MKRTHVNQVVHHLSHNNNKRWEDKDRNNEEEEAEERRREALRRHAHAGRVQHVLKECRRAFQVPQSGEKHHHHQKRKEKENQKKKEKGDQYEYQYDRYGQQIQQEDGLQQQQQQQSVSKRGGEGDALREYDSMVHDVMTTMSRRACASAQSHGKAKDYKRVSQSLRPRLADSC